MYTIKSYRLHPTLRWLVPPSLTPFSSVNNTPFSPHLESQISSVEAAKVLHIIYNIKLEEPFTASGFFGIDLSTLTSLASTILTYLIVLVQFQPSSELGQTDSANSTFSPNRDV